MIVQYFIALVIENIQNKLSGRLAHNSSNFFAPAVGNEKDFHLEYCMSREVNNQHQLVLSVVSIFLY